MTWNDYATGFGDPTSSDFWLGLEHMHLLTTSANYLLRVELQAEANGKYDNSANSVVGSVVCCFSGTKLMFYCARYSVRMGNKKIRNALSPSDEGVRRGATAPRIERPRREEFQCS